ncbi:phage scaffolding protein [Mammaliicoccus sp. Dog046]|uniref:phage scaffolding protein n=1 Tax=Mammaliicoccus sp. Dog046 TaxID=3034233 RepID=UPI002B25CB0F|nr:phage scaffolding protein [Mammaliicoccus sp. Dog046]WQK85426.1 phage scaffolding protein [Mammaliicoccus sp. Dog046]
MNREQLRDIKLSAEQIKRVMALYGQSINQQSNKIKELEADNEMLTNKINNIDNQSSNDDKRVLELESERDYLKQELERHKDLIDECELDKAILKNVARDMHDPEDIFKVLDKDRFQINNDTGEVINLDKVLEEVREQKNYLFKA